MPQEKAGPRIVKRYQNRKLYDTEQSCYVTLDEIATMVKNGEDVKVIDNKSGEDLTSLTLTQIIFEEEKKKKSILPLAALRNIIQSGGESIQGLRERLREGIDPLFHVKEETEQRLQKLLNKGDLTKEEYKSLFAEFFQSRQRTVDVIQKNLDERIKFYVNKMLGQSDDQEEAQNYQEEIDRLKDRIRFLEKKIEEMTKG